MTTDKKRIVVAEVGTADAATQPTNITVLDPLSLRRPQDFNSGMSAIMNRWPGDETDEEVQAALDQLS